MDTNISPLSEQDILNGYFPSGCCSYKMPRWAPSKTFRFYLIIRGIIRAHPTLQTELLSCWRGIVPRKNVRCKLRDQWRNIGDVTYCKSLILQLGTDKNILCYKYVFIKFCFSYHEFSSEYFEKTYFLRNYNIVNKKIIYLDCCRIYFYIILLKKTWHFSFKSLKLVLN